MSGSDRLPAVLAADLLYTEKRLADARRKADEQMRKNGARTMGADFHCDWVEHVLTEKRRSLDAIAELIEAAQPFRHDPNCLGNGDHYSSGLLVRLRDIRRLHRVLLKIEGGAA